VTEALRIALLGFIVRCPLGGMTWHHLQYAMGLSALGHDVTFIEDSEDYESCYDPTTDSMGTNASYGLRYAQDTFTRVGLGDIWAYHDAHTDTWHGPAAGTIEERMRRAQLVINLSGVNPLHPSLAEAPVRAFIDHEPALTQVRHLTDPRAVELAKQHNRFLTFGENIGSSSCTVPDDGFDWQPTRQPVVLDAWPVTPGPPDGRFTTVMQWDSHPPRDLDGARYGMKSGSFMPYIDLPQKVESAFELAMGNATAPVDLLRSKGWELRNPLGPSRDLGTYQGYIASSKGEFTVAKHGYVVTHGGWFSERSAVYMASGRPVLTQETGFSDWLPTGEGVLAFSSPDEAIAGVQEINARYDLHCRRARELVDGYFDARKVLSDMIEDLMDPQRA
jgi:hypothetical protein